jgi:hypothetical protein
VDDDLDYSHKKTDAMNRSTKFLLQNGHQNSQYDAEIRDLSKTLVQIDQNLLTYCDDVIGAETILPDLALDLSDAGRAEDALRVADECHRRYPNNPYCIQASAEALHKLGRNTEARAAAKWVIQRGPYDAKMEAAILTMRSLLTLIDAEEDLRAVKDRLRALQKQNEKRL